jgi:hypothetical protein
MSDFQRRLYHSLTFRYLVAGIFSFSLMITPLTAIGSESDHYVPPSNPSRPSTPVGSTATRSGCDGTAAVPLTALAPADHVGKTTSTHPTFAWYVPEGASRPIEFNLYEQGENDQPRLLQRVSMTSTPHVMTYTLPPNQLELTVGRQYHWQVRLLCDPDSPSSALTIEAWMEVIPTPAALQMSFAMNQTPLQQAQQFAQAGIWYDALANALGDRSDPYWLQLLNDLVQTETADLPLQKVIEFEQGLSQ